MASSPAESSGPKQGRASLAPTLQSLTPVERLLLELIAIPSVNPAFAPAADPRSGEERVAQFLAATAVAAGLDAELKPVFPGRPNVIVRLRSSQRARHTVLLAPHLDTVGSAEGGNGMFEPKLQGARILGRGACDTKGSVAAMLGALMDLVRRGPVPRHAEVVFAGLIDEENGQSGSRALVAQGFRADLAIVGEPTRLQVVTAHKGDLWLQLEVRGRAAHGATPHLGVNAVRTMARVVEVLEGEYADLLRRRRHPLLGPPTVNVGKIAGGTQPNVVPHHCAIHIDRRTLPGETRSGVRREIRRVLGRRDLLVRFLDLRRAPCPALETDPNDPWVRRFLAAARQTRPVGVHYFCDAAVLASGGIPSVVFGPGDIAQAHTENEWVSRVQLNRATDLLTRFLRTLD